MSSIPVEAAVYVSFDVACVPLVQTMSCLYQRLLSLVFILCQIDLAWSATRDPSWQSSAALHQVPYDFSNMWFMRHYNHVSWSQRPCLTDHFFLLLLVLFDNYVIITCETNHRPIGGCDQTIVECSWVVHLTSGITHQNVVRGVLVWSLWIISDTTLQIVPHNPFWFGIFIQKSIILESSP